MKRISSSVAIFVLLAALGGLTLLAMPRGLEGDTTAPSNVFPRFAPASEAALSESLAPDATNKWTAIAIPLDVSGSGISMASHVANYIASGDPDDAGNGSIKRLMKWDLAQQKWIEYTPQFPLIGDPDFAVEPGGALLVLADSSLQNTTLSWLGDVPESGVITNTLAANAWNFIMVPLDQYAMYGSPGAPVGTASDLADDITGVSRVMKWDAVQQKWIEYYPDFPLLGDDDFDVYAGYPYMIRTNSSSPTQWP